MRLQPSLTGEGGQTRVSFPSSGASIPTEPWDLLGKLCGTSWYRNKVNCNKWSLLQTVIYSTMKKKTTSCFILILRKWGGSKRLASYVTSVTMNTFMSPTSFTLCLSFQTITLRGQELSHIGVYIDLNTTTLFGSSQSYCCTIGGDVLDQCFNPYDTESAPEVRERRHMLRPGEH